ncbi:proline iminopeptidase [Companilactobacillus nantensis]|uniref:Proline iminopeptidase n=1 Tax=Companilactobacillus nantensis DSM 16982 TaxID=1423774 RepID=A0A0R1WIV2_9LACO|nr:proline iminopeptidase-family hydrolase [Companilactobacillus nantensis]KRM17806.1 prolyl aminopeptidase [Companilactobacillus nantensis DSM 16982]GEO63505.1 proline iminopeptidase [Companilactobacillus nantensis]
MEITEGYMPFHEYKTYYRIVGDLNTNRTPLLLLHGGPGSTHNYFEIFDQLTKQTGRPVVMYDQLGCGKSSIPDDSSLFQADTWVEELKSLREYLGLKEVHLLGQSWGGMLAIIYMCDHNPEGVKSLILASTLSSAKLWAQEQHRMIKFMSVTDQKAIAQAEETNDYTSSAYLTANEHFMLQHASGPITSASPEFLRRPKVSGEVSYVTAWGPNEYCPTGTLRNYDYTDKLHNIVTPTLVTSGTNDLCTPLVAKTMVDQLPNAEWSLFAKSRHMAFIDETKSYMQRLTAWLADND